MDETTATETSTTEPEAPKAAHTFIVLVAHSTCETSTINIGADTPEQAVAAALAQYPGSSPVIIGELVADKFKAKPEEEDKTFTVYLKHKNGDEKTLKVKAKTAGDAKARALSGFSGYSAIVQD